jgi:hypothetical protein
VAREVGDRHFLASLVHEPAVLPFLFDREGFFTVGHQEAVIGLEDIL